MRGGALACSLLALLLLAALGSTSAQAAKKLPHINNVFIIVLENENADSTFGPDAPAYLAKKLPSKGLFMPDYYATGHLSLDNYISMVSGQAPNPQTQADCQMFSDFLPGIPAADGQVIGTGCVYPTAVQTVADQLEKEGLGWKGYMEDMANGAPAAPVSCRHPAIGAMDDTQHAEVGDQYATRHNPFMYFHSIIDDKKSCNANDVDLSHMAKDLKKRRTTAAYNFITPNLCHDGHDEPCVNGEPGGLVSANKFLEQKVPQIMHSPAYERHGLIVITFDEAEAIGGEGDSSACCNEQPGPNTTSPGFTTPGPGGGRIGAVLLSPCIRSGSTTDQDYNHYSLLRSVEDNFDLSHLGFAGQQRLRPFGTDVLNRPDCHERIHLVQRSGAPRAGEKGAYRFAVNSTYDRCTKGVKVKLGGHTAKTDKKGKATIRAKLGKPRQARADKKGCKPDQIKVRPRGG